MGYLRLMLCLLYPAIVTGAGVTGALCPDLTPPVNGVLKCQALDTTLQCTATCFNGYQFETGDHVVQRTCEENSFLWLEGSRYLPVCVQSCDIRLITKANSDLQTSSTLSLASDIDPQATRLSASEAWRPAVDNILQYIQVDLGSQHLIRGWTVRGDGQSSYVRLFRLLFSVDGLTWNPYFDGRVVDKFFTGNFDSGTEVVQMLSIPQAARYVRLNPLSWHLHIALNWELIGCPHRHTSGTVEPPDTGDVRCKLPQPPESGAVNCERNGTHLVCTAYCLNNRVFPDLGPALDLTCNPSDGLFTNTPLPPCVERNTTVSPLNISGPCMQEEGDCFQMDNGDYQYCGDCHYFSTCSHDYFFLRPCPEQLQFDSVHGLCDYHSSTCNTGKRRSLYKEATKELRARRQRQQTALPLPLQPGQGK